VTPVIKDHSNKLTQAVVKYLQENEPQEAKPSKKRKSVQNSNENTVFQACWLARLAVKCAQSVSSESKCPNKSIVVFLSAMLYVIESYVNS